MLTLRQTLLCFPRGKKSEKKGSTFFLLIYFYIDIQNSNNFGISRKAKYLSRCIFDLLLVNDSEKEKELIEKAAVLSFVYGFQVFIASMQIDERMGKELGLEKHHIVDQLISNYGLQSEMNNFQRKLFGDQQLEYH